MIFMNQPRRQLLFPPTQEMGQNLNKSRGKGQCLVVPDKGVATGTPLPATSACDWGRVTRFPRLVAGVIR